MGEGGERHQQVYQAKATKALPMDPPVVSLQPEGKLIILTSGGHVVVQLDAGDAVLFRYDVKHGGAAYGSKHIRLHEYWEPTRAGNIQFRVGNHHASHGGNQLHAIETEASWNKLSARSNPGKIYCGATWAYVVVVIVGM